jgi:hypothetical protein
MTEQVWRCRVVDTTASNLSDECHRVTDRIRWRRPVRSTASIRQRTKMFRTMTCIALVLGPIGLAPPAAAICAAPKSVSGVWASNDHGTYYMRRVGHNVWWLGDGPGDSWMNVFKGTEDGQTITGQWADVNPVSGSGTLTLKIHGQLDHGILGFERIGSTGDGFAGTRWFKPCNDQ